MRTNGSQTTYVTGTMTSTKQTVSRERCWCTTDAQTDIKRIVSLSTVPHPLDMRLL